MPLYSLVQQLRQSRLLQKTRRWLTPARRRQLWHGITIISIGLITFGLARTWRELPKEQLQIMPIYLGEAFAIYALTYTMHLLGWHALATLTFGRLPLRDNIEAVAASDLVKYLPTVAWYIANRVHFYDQRQIRRRSVIAASLLEMVTLLGSGAITYLALWLSHTNTWLTPLVIFSAIALTLRFGQPKIKHWWHTRIAIHRTTNDSQPRLWAVAIFWYGFSWILGALFLAAILHTFVPLTAADYLPLLEMWLIAGLVGTIVSISFGAVGIAREATLTFMLAQLWPLPISIAVAVLVKIILTAGQVIFALLVLGWLRLQKKELP